MNHRFGALNPIMALKQTFSDLAEATMLFEQVDQLPPEEYLALVARLHDDASTVISLTFTVMTDGVRAKIPEKAWEEHTRLLMQRQRDRTPEERDRQIASVLSRLTGADAINIIDDEAPGD